MKYALVIIEMPKDATDTRSGWPQVRQDVRDFARKKAESIELLNETTMLLSLDGQLNLFAELLFQLAQISATYRVLFFDQQPEWVLSTNS